MSDKRLEEMRKRAENPSLLFNSQDAHIALTRDIPHLLSLIDEAKHALAAVQMDAINCPESPTVPQYFITKWAMDKVCAALAKLS